MLEAELIGRKEARRAAPDYNPAMILMSPFEDARLVLAQCRREHPELGDYELIEYAIVEPRAELCMPASRAAGAAWQARMAKEAMQMAEQSRREVAVPPPVSEPVQERRTEQAPAKDATPPVHSPQPAPQPMPRHNGASEPWLGPHTWMNR
jgi:hypothetical protein